MSLKQIFFKQTQKALTITITTTTINWTVSNLSSKETESEKASQRPEEINNTYARYLERDVTAWWGGRAGKL